MYQRSPAGDRGASASAELAAVVTRGDHHARGSHRRQLGRPAVRFPAHVRGLQRGWKFLENLANTEFLAPAKPGSCTLFVGALKHVGGSGGAARVFAQCERP